MSESKKVIDIALAEVGYIEKKSNSQLDSKTANAGKNNYTKYARDLDNIPGFYNGKKNGYDWCDVFVDWCFVKAFGKERAMKLLNQPAKSTGAGCGYSMSFYKKIGQLFKTPKAGDQIFFGSGTDIYHTGLVYKVENGRVYTIEGNTSSASEVVANGGVVAKKSYPVGASYIAGYGRPKYTEEAKQEPKQEPKKEVVDTGVITYRAYAEKWLPEVKKCDSTDDGFAGIGTKTISGFKCKPQYGELIYEAHSLGGKWLGAVSSKNYSKNDSNSYAGIYGKAIDGIRIKSSKGNVDYRVKTKEDGWLGWARGFGDKGNEFAGIYGHKIIGIQIK